MVSNCVLSSHLTHQAPLCKEACVALGCAIAASLRAKTTGADPVAAVLDALEEVCHLTDYRGMLAVCAFPSLIPSFPCSPLAFSAVRPRLNGWSRQAMLAAGPKLQDAIDAMHSLQPVSDLFRSQVGDR